MPSMPDPVSECPIFGRMYDVFSDQTNVTTALNLLKSSDDFVAIGVAIGIIKTDSYWDCDCNGTVERVNEAQWLYKYWLNEDPANPPNPDPNESGWWPECSDLKERLLKGT